MRLLSARTLAFLLASVARVAAAQVSGVVRGSSDQPLADATVAIERAGQVRAFVITRADGRFFLREDGPGVGGTRHLLVRRLGFRPATLDLPRDTTGLQVHLEPLAQNLAAVAVKTTVGFTGDPCSRKSSVAAHQLYARVASHYRDDTRWLDRIARYAHSIRVGPSDDREVILGVPIRAGWMRNSGLYLGSRTSVVTAVPRSLSDSARFALPFPRPEPRRGSVGQILGWAYPRFQDWGSPSFVSRAFIDSMPLAIVSAPSGTVLSFCQPFNGESSVVGEIELTADSTVSAVRWGFFAKETANEMGGVAYFDPPARTTSRAHLLPRSSTVWVRLQKSNMFEITEYAFGRWSVAELGESVREVPPGGG